MLSGHFSVLPGHTPLRTDDEVCLRAGAGAGMKVELAVPPPTYGGDEMKSREQAAHSSGWSSERDDGGFINRGGRGTGRLCDLLAGVPGCLGKFDYGALEELEKDPNVKLELGV